MTFSKKQPTVEGYYWYKSHPSHAPEIGHLLRYANILTGKKQSNWFVMPFGYDYDNDFTLTGNELWGKRIEEP